MKKVVDASLVPKIVTISPARRAASSSSESNENVSAAGQKPHLLVRKSVKLRRGKKVLTQDMTHNSWLHSAPQKLWWRRTGGGGNGTWRWRRHSGRMDTKQEDPNREVVP